MNRIRINTFEEIHHVCLMYGLKKAFSRFPFLTANIMATPPPVRRKPECLRPLLGFRRHPIWVQYFKKDLYVVYNEEMVVLKDVTAFAKAVIEEYLAYRHPYMKTYWSENSLSETGSGHIIAEIIPESLKTDDML